MSVLRFYNTLVHYAPVLDPALQREIRSFAERKNENSLLVALLGRGDLDPEIERQLSASKQLPVLVAWASRPGRTPAELQQRLLSETRVAALLPLAELPDLPADVYRAIAAVKSTKLGEVLAGNPAVPLEIRVDKIREFAARTPRRSYNPGAVLAVLCGDEPALYQAAVSTACVTGYLAVCVKSGSLTEDGITAVVDRFRQAMPPGSYEHATSVVSLVESLSQVPLTYEHIQVISDACGTIKQTHSHHLGSWASQRLDEALRTMNKRQGPLSEKIRDLTAATDPELVKGLYAEACTLASDADDMVRLADAAVVNPHTPTEIIRAEYAAYRLDTGRFRLLLERLDERGDVEFMAQVIRDGRAPYVSLDGLGNAASAVRTAVLELRAAHLPVPYWLRGASFVLADAELTLEAFPWSSVVEMLPGAPDELSAKVQSTLVSELGSDQRLWEMFETLGNDYEGSFHELVATVKELA